MDRVCPVCGKEVPPKFKKYCSIECNNRNFGKLTPVGFFDSEKQSKRRRSQIHDENVMAREMIAEGWEIFSPTVVCDRIGIKDRKVYFIEFKKNLKQKLRPGQLAVQSLSPENFIIRIKSRV